MIGKWKTALFIVLLITLLTMLPAAANADPTFTDLATWQAAVGTFTETTSFGSSGSSITSTTLTDGTVLSFGVAQSVLVAGSTWATWCCGYTGQVLFGGTITTQTWSISPVSAFGMFLEPNSLSPFTVTLLLSSGDLISQTVDGNAGAAFFGWVGSDVTQMTITTTDSLGVGAGDMFSAVPEPSSLWLLASGLPGLGIWLHRKRK